MKANYALKNRHAGLLGCKVLHPGGPFFSCKRGKKSIALR